MVIWLFETPPHPLWRVCNDQSIGCPVNKNLQSSSGIVMLYNLFISCYHKSLTILSILGAEFFVTVFVNDQ